MKFKSNTPVTAQDLELAEVQFESLDFTEMDKAQELLEDLTVLNQNIEKFGITEPVMHLVGGTLEAMDISIASKEACLEGLGDKMKEAGKKIWEFIINLFKKIRDFVKAWLDKGAKKSIEVYNGVKEKFSNVNAEGLLPKDAISKVKEFARTAPNTVKNTSIDIANSAKGLFERGVDGAISVGKSVKDAITGVFANKKGYTDKDELARETIGLIEQMESLQKTADACIAEAEKESKSDAEGSQERAKHFQQLGKATSAVISMIAKHVAAAKRVLGGKEDDKAEGQK